MKKTHLYGLVCLICVFVTAACGEARLEDSSGSAEETTAEVAERENPDEIYYRKIEEETRADFPEDLSEMEDWYGDYQFVEYTRPHSYPPSTPDYLQRKLDQMKGTIKRIEPGMLITYFPVDRVLEPVFYEDYEYDHYISVRSFTMHVEVLDEELLKTLLMRWGREYHLDGSPVDFSNKAHGDDDLFADMDFRISDYVGHQILVFTDEDTTSTIKECDYWINAGDGVVYSLTNHSVSKWQRLR